MSELPAGWIKCAIGDIAKIVGGATPNSSDPTNFTEEGGIPWLTPADLSGYTGMYISRGKRNITEKGYQSCSAKLMPPGTVLFSSRAPIGYVVIARNKVCTSQGFKSFIPNSRVKSEYLYYYLKFAKKEIEQLGTGSTFPEISGKKAERIPLILAPESEQKRIAEKLEQIFGELDSTKARLGKIPAILKKIREHIFFSAVQGKLTENYRKNTPLEPIQLDGVPSKKIYKSAICNLWKAVKVRDLYKTWGGGTPKRSSAEYWNGNINWFSSGDVKSDILYKSSETITALGLQNSSAKMCPKGSVIAVVRSGILQHTFPVSILGEASSINQDIKCFDSEDELLNYWLFLNWKAKQNDILAMNREGTTVQSVRYNTLKEWEIHIPPREEIIKIRELVARADALISEMEDKYQSAMDNVNQIAQSVLNKAFRGELVPQHSSDEPASVLLRKAKAEKELQALNLKRSHAAANKKAKEPRNKSKGKQVIKKLQDVLSEEWLSAQEAFEFCGIGYGSQTEEIETLYAELRFLDKMGKLETDTVYNSEGTKQFDRLKLKKAS